MINKEHLEILDIRIVINHDPDPLAYSGWVDFRSNFNGIDYILPSVLMSSGTKDCIFDSLDLLLETYKEHKEKSNENQSKT